MSNPGVRLIVPLQDYPLTENDRVTLSWSRFFTTLAQLAGGSSVPTTDSVVIRLINGGFLGAYDATTGELLGTIPLADQPGGIPQVVVITASPQVYKAISDGQLVVFAAALEISRDSGVTWYQVSLQGGGLRLLIGDWARVTWYGAAPPTITWFPDGAE